MRIKNNKNKMITIEDFKKVEIKIGEILSAEKIPDSDKLLKLIVDFGENNRAGEKQDDFQSQATSASGRQIVSGISVYYPDPQVLVGKKCAFATNLEPRVIRGFESQGMILAVSGDDFFSLLETSKDVLAGSQVK